MNHAPVAMIELSGTQSRPSGNLSGRSCSEPKHITFTWSVPELRHCVRSAASPDLPLAGRDAVVQAVTQQGIGVQPLTRIEP